MLAASQLFVAAEYALAYEFIVDFGEHRMLYAVVALSAVFSVLLPKIVEEEMAMAIMRFEIGNHRIDSCGEFFFAVGIDGWRQHEAVCEYAATCEGDEWYELAWYETDDVSAAKVY